MMFDLYLFLFIFLSYSFWTLKTQSHFQQFLHQDVQHDKIINTTEVFEASFDIS